MPKIKNWNKTKERGSSITWENNIDGKTRVTLSKNDSNQEMGWQVLVNELTSDKPIKRRTFGTKESAKNWSMKYMRNNPKG